MRGVVEGERGAAAAECGYALGLAGSMVMIWRDMIPGHGSDDVSIAWASLVRYSSPRHCRAFTRRHFWSSLPLDLEARCRHLRWLTLAICYSGTLCTHTLPPRLRDSARRRRERQDTFCQPDLDESNILYHPPDVIEEALFTASPIFSHRDYPKSPC